MSAVLCLKEDGKNGKVLAVRSRRCQLMRKDELGS